MPRRHGEDVDWYVEMSEHLERREHRRKWIILGVCVAVPLLLLGALAGLVLLKDHIPGLRSIIGFVIPKRTDPSPRPGPERMREVQVDNFVGVLDIRFNQIDPASGLVLTSTHVFREYLPENARGFLVETEDNQRGKIRNYRLRNLGTGEAYDFTDVPVKRAGEAGWAIDLEIGWKAIRDQLAAKMKIQLAMPIVGRN